MKRFSVALAVAVIFLLGSSELSLAQHKQDEMKTKSKGDSSRVQYGTKGSAVDESKTDTLWTPRAVDPNIAASMKEIVGHYLLLKNALANDKTKDAAAAGKEIVNTMGQLDKSFLTTDQRELYEDVEDDAIEHAEHIGENVGNIAHQREHFDVLSRDVYDLVKAFGGGQVLYKSFCSMYNDKKGAIWLSETKTIKNPYYGKKMATCGSVQEELK